MKPRTRVLTGVLFCAFIFSGLISPGMSLSSAWVAALPRATEQQRPHTLNTRQ